MLVDEETIFLATIDRYKTEAHKYNREVSIQKFLDRVAQPKRWKYKDGTTTEMELVIFLCFVEIRIPNFFSAHRIRFELEN